MVELWKNESVEWHIAPSFDAECGGSPFALKIIAGSENGFTLLVELGKREELTPELVKRAAARAVKFGASNFIPIIGGSVSEAYSTVYASIGVIRSGVGTIGTAAVTVMLLRPLVSILCVKLTLIISRIISDLLGLSETSELLRSTDSAMSAAVSTLLTFALMFIVATAVIMLIR